MRTYTSVRDNFVNVRKRTYVLLVLLIVGIYLLGAPMIFASIQPAGIEALFIAVGIMFALVPLPIMDQYL